MRFMTLFLTLLTFLYINAIQQQFSDSNYLILGMLHGASAGFMVKGVAKLPRCKENPSK